MTNNDEDPLSELTDLVETLTTSGKRTLDGNLLKRVKSICKCSDENIRHLYRMVMTQLEKEHSEIRLSSLQIITEIFSRSHAFRELLLDDFQKFLSLSVGVNCKEPLPEPTAVARVLRNQALKAIEKWHQKYGPHYMKLSLGYIYLTRVKKFNFDDPLSHTEVERLRAQDIETRRANRAECKLSAILVQMSNLVSEIQNVIVEAGNCFQLILPTPEEFDIYSLNSGDSTSEQIDNDRPSTSSGITHRPLSNSAQSLCTNEEGSLSYGEQDSVSHVERGSLMHNKQDSVTHNKQGSLGHKLSNHGLVSEACQLTIPLTLSTSLKIFETADNTDVLNTLREQHKQIVDKYLPLTQKWLEVLSKHSGHHENLIQAIDLKNSLIELKNKFEKLRIVSTNSDSDENKDDDSTDDFIDVPEKEGLQNQPKSHLNEYGFKQMESVNKTRGLKLSILFNA